MDVVIRDATDRDPEAIAVLITQLNYPTDANFIVRRLAEFLENPHAFVIVADLDEEVVGVLSFNSEIAFHKEGRIGSITSLSVRDDMRGKNIGSLLVEECEKRARAQGCYRIAVASGVQRLKAHEFYRNRGYEEKTKRFVKDFDL
jgi:N-acetylglutamate synthase-like GNAT family acetyltransferase